MINSDYYKVFNKKYFYASFLFITFILERKLISNKSIFIKNDKGNTIFTFWEPIERMPGYIKLCIKTWKKFLPLYDIRILDYKNIKDYLGQSLFENLICKNMTLPKQADAIRVALLNKYRGIWMDADTIVLNGEFLQELKSFELAMFGDEKIKSQNIGFIYSSGNSSILKKWLKEIIYNVQIYKQYSEKNQLNLVIDNAWKKMNSWDYLGNGILDKLVKNVTSKQFCRIDRQKMNTLPEIRFFENSSLDLIQRYKQFYFQNRDPEIILNKSKSVVMLHNSWTPVKYKLMSEKQFLNQDILLSRLLAYILKR